MFTIFPNISDDMILMFSKIPIFDCFADFPGQDGF